MQVPENAKKAAKKQVDEQRMFIPTIKHVYIGSIQSDSYPEVFRENAKVGEVWYNGEKKVASTGEPFSVVPISYRGRVSYKDENGEKKVHLNPCFSKDIKPVKSYDDVEDCPVDINSKNLGADVLVYVPAVDEFAVMIFKPSAMEDFSSLLSVAEAPSVTIGTNVTKFKAKEGGNVTYYRFAPTAGTEKVEVPDSTLANATYQMLNQE